MGADDGNSDNDILEDSPSEGIEKHEPSRSLDRQDTNTHQLPDVRESPLDSDHSITSENETHEIRKSRKKVQGGGSRSPHQQTRREAVEGKSRVIFYSSDDDDSILEVRNRDGLRVIRAVERRHDRNKKVQGGGSRSPHQQAQREVLEEESGWLPYGNEDNSLEHEARVRIIPAVERRHDRNKKVQGGGSRSPHQQARREVLEEESGWLPYGNEDDSLEHEARDKVRVIPAVERRHDRNECVAEDLADFHGKLCDFIFEIIGKFSALASIASAASIPNISVPTLYDEIGRIRVWAESLTHFDFGTNQNMSATIRVALEDLNMLVDRGLIAICKPLLPNESSGEMPQKTTCPEPNTSTEIPSSSIPDTDMPLVSSQDIYEDIDLKNVDVQEVLEEVYQVIADLYQLSLSFTQSREIRRLGKNAFRIVDVKDISTKTLDLYKLPWEPKGEYRIEIKQVISDDDLEILLDHTAKLREAQRTTALLLNADNLERLGLESEWPEIRIDRTSSRPKGLLDERAMAINPEFPWVEGIRKSRGFRWGKEKRPDVLLHRRLK